MPPEREAIVIGGGQAGLAMSYYLSEVNCDHIVLERDRIGERWRSEKWDSFTLVTPNWMNRLPGFPYQGTDPDGFLTRDEVVAYLEEYVEYFDPPVRCVSRRRPSGGTGQASRLRPPPAHTRQPTSWWPPGRSNDQESQT